MDRRELFGVLAVVALGGVATPAEPAPVRRFFRYVRSLDRWQPVGFDDIRGGWEVWINDPDGSNVVVYVRALAVIFPAPGVDSPARLVLAVSGRIDPATNTWVNWGCDRWFGREKNAALCEV